MVGEVCNMENGCVPGRSMNIKEKLLASADMQRKAIEILSAIMRDVTGAEREEMEDLVETCIDGMASQSLNRMDCILGILCEIRDALGVSV